MAITNYADYVAFVNSQNDKNGNGSSTRNGQFVNFFKLKPNQSALVRFDISSLDSMDGMFAAVHHAAYIPGANNKFNGLSNWMSGVKCLESNCPLCKAVKDGNTKITPARTKIFVKMLAAYKNDAGGFDEPVPCVWEKPASFSNELASKIELYKDLTKIMFVIHRTGSGKDDTKYSIDVAPAAVFPASLVPADFSAFENFDISKHSYYVKTADDMNTYLTSGSFPEVAKSAAQPTSNTKVEPQPVNTQPQNSFVAPTPTQQFSIPVEPTPQPQPTNNDPFKWFSK